MARRKGIRRPRRGRGPDVAGSGNVEADEVEKIVSIPEDVTLSPQSAGPPPGLRGQDRSRQRERVHELTWARFDQMVTSLARQIRKAFRPDAVVGVAHGGVFVGAALASALRVDFFPVRISRRSRDRVVRQAPRISGEMPRELRRKRVLVVDDVASSGDTLELARALLARVGATETRTCSLISREGGYLPDWCALTTAEFWCFPWDYQTVAEDGRFDVDPDKAGA
jgi:hypothetical protein